MRAVALVLGVSALLLITPSGALAQEAPTFGVTMGYPTTVGVLWHVTDAVAIRPEVGFRFISQSAELSGLPDILGDLGALGFERELESDARSVTIGVSGLFFTGEFETVRTYVSPRIAYSNTSSSRESGLGFAELDLDQSGIEVGGFVGAQFSPNTRFGLFGEAGLEYSRSSANAFSTRQELSAVGTAGRVGVVLYWR